MRSPKRHLPSLVTALNLFAGFLSVVYSIHGDYARAAWLIGIAGIMDVLDGKVARLTKSSSEFGVELDSLADVASFGFAPAILVYKSYFMEWGAAGALLSFMPLCFGGIRLARFNVGVADHSEKDSYFTGLPIPSSAITLAAFVVFEQSVFEGVLHREAMAGLTVLVSFLMISRIRYEGMPNFSFKRAQDTVRIIVLLLAFGATLLYPAKMIFPLMMLFITIGIVRGIIQLILKQKNVADDDVQDIPVID